MEQLSLADASYTIDRAAHADVPSIVALLRDDVLGSSRESDDLTPYLEAFDAIDQDLQHLLVVPDSARLFSTEPTPTAGAAARRWLS